MIYGNDNKPVCESAEIIKYMDPNFDGQLKLNAEVEADETLRQRFDELYNLWKEWDNDGYTFGTYD